MKITLEEILTGYRIYKDNIYLLGNLFTKHHKGLYRDGVIQYELMPTSSWAIHWTSPHLNVDDIKAAMVEVELKINNQ